MQSFEYSLRVYPFSNQFWTFVHVIYILDRGEKTGIDGIDACCYIKHKTTFHIGPFESRHEAKNKGKRKALAKLRTYK